MAEQAWRPRFCVRAQRSGPPRVSVRPHYEGPPSQEGRYGSDEGRRKPPGSRGMKILRSGPDEPVPGWRTPQVERRKAACPQGHAGTFYACQTKMVRHFGAPLPHVGEGREMTALPAPDKERGR